MITDCYKWILLMVPLALPCVAQTNHYPWRMGARSDRDVASEIRAPAGFRRTTVDPGSFADWLRHLPLKEKGAPVLLYDGKRKPNQSAHFAVIDIDIGAQDLQQCADAVIRLRAEYLYSKKQFDAVHFNFTSGHKASFAKWASGYRPIVNANKVTWIRKGDKDSSYGNFRKYLKSVFAYAGTYSLARELEPRSKATEIEVGDVFIREGFPGHAVIVVDMAEEIRTREKAFLLAQSYMPAQDVHILKNPVDSGFSPWYKIPTTPVIQTPEWDFHKSELKYFVSESRRTSAYSRPYY